MDITSDAYKSITDGQDFYIMVIDDEANNLDYATYFGELNYGGVISYVGITGTMIPCMYSGHDHVDGGTSRFDNKGFIYQSVCASCGLSMLSVKTTLILFSRAKDVILASPILTTS